MGAATKPTFRQVLVAAGLVFLAAGAGIAIYLFARTAPPPLALQTDPKKQQAEPEILETQAAAQPAAAPRTERPTTTAVAAAPAPTTPEAQPHAKLVGTWQLLVQVDESRQAELARFELDDRTNPITAKSRPQYQTKAELDGMQLRVVSKRDEVATFTFTGMLNPSYTEATGTYETEHRSTDLAAKVHRDSYPAQLVRLSREFLENEHREQELRNSRFEEANTIYGALKRFAARNDGKFPTSLAQLTPEDLPDRSLIAGQPGRTITYTGGAALARTETIAEAAKEFRENEISTEGLIAYEQKLREVCGGEIPFQAKVLRIEYDNPPLAIDMSASGHSRSSDEGETAPPGGEEEPALAMRESEFNNLKQLGLVCKMFGNENKDFMPGGWIMVYPEYLTDLEVLRSPWAPEGTVSYDLVFPGENERDLEALARELVESGALQMTNPEQPIGQSEIPLVIARDNLPADPEHKPARAVLFLDGHVEAVQLTEWDARIAPFLP